MSMDMWKDSYIRAAAIAASGCENYEPTQEDMRRMTWGVEGFILAIKKKEETETRIVEMVVRAMREAEELDDGVLLRPEDAKKLNDALDQWEIANPNWDVIMSK